MNNKRLLKIFILILSIPIIIFITVILTLSLFISKNKTSQQDQTSNDINITPTIQSNNSLTKYKIGDTISTKNIDMIVEKIETDDDISPCVPIDNMANSMKYTSIYITFKNISSEDVQLSTIYDLTSKEYIKNDNIFNAYTFNLILGCGKNPYFDGYVKTLGSGQSVSGWITFLTTPDAKNFILYSKTDNFEVDFF